jgi:hypothetical protein
MSVDLMKFYLICLHIAYTGFISMLQAIQSKRCKP